MSNFSSCYSKLIKSDASHSWIALHRCIESYAKTSGYSYKSIFKRYEVEFNFDRSIPKLWPEHKKILMIGEELKKERDQYINELQLLIEKRREEKRRGIRDSKDELFLAMCHRQNNYPHEKIEPWGWKKRRMEQEEVRQKK